MNLTQLTAFHAVMTSASISEAARKLGRTQPAVSLAVRGLEETLGIKLFAREGRRLVPVPEAHYLHAEARSILDRMATVGATMRSLSKAQAGYLNVAAMPGPSAHLFPRFISAAVDGKDVTVSIAARSSRQIWELAATQRIDFGFCDAPPPTRKRPNYAGKRISAECFCALSTDHPLAHGKSVRVAELDGVPMGAVQANHLHQERTLALFREEGATFNMAVDSQYFLPLMHFIAAGQCCAIVDPLTVVTETRIDSGCGRIVFRPLDRPIRYDYGLLSASRRPLSQLAESVMNGWHEELLLMLDGVNARPDCADLEIETAAPD